MKNSLYWAFNLPLQVWPNHEDPNDESSPIIDYRILNYMPRKERTCDALLSDLVGEQTREEFLETAALHFENLARLFRDAIANPSRHIYYHDDGMPSSEASVD